MAVVVVVMVAVLVAMARAFVRAVARAVESLSSIGSMVKMCHVRGKK